MLGIADNGKSSEGLNADPGHRMIEQRGDLFPGRGDFVTGHDF